MKLSLISILVLLISCGRDTVGPQLFEPDNISTGDVEYAITFSASGDELYFARSSQEWGKGDMQSSIYYSIRENGNWSTPVVASFSGNFNDSDPHLSDDGQSLFFISDRPIAGTTLSPDIWKVEKGSAGKWGLPIRMPAPINSTGTEYSPCLDTYGNLYFASDRAGGLGQGDLYFCRFQDGEWSTPENLGQPINSPLGEWNLEVNKNGDVLIFEASQREENISPYGDLYISFKEGGIWSTPKNIQEFNTSGSDLYPHLTHDEGSLFLPAATV